MLVALVLVDQTAPRPEVPGWHRLLWLISELVLCFFVVRVHGTLVRPALIYLLPTSQALLMFGQRVGLALSFSVWLAYGVNVGLYAWPNRLHEFPNYLSFFLATYLVGALLTLATIQQATHRRRVQKLYEELQTAHEELKVLHDQARDAAVTQERNRLAREIHDSLAHYLTIVNVQLEAAEKLGPKDTDRALEQVRRARRLTLDCLQEVRRSVAALRSSSLEELSLPGAITKLAVEFSETTGIAVQLKLGAPEDIRVTPETALALYRVAQEGLTNVHKHARATDVQISLATHAEKIELVVEDNGIGPQESTGNEARGLGLQGLRERVELLEGELYFEPAPSGGSRLSVVLSAGKPYDGGSTQAIS